MNELSPEAKAFVARAVAAGPTAVQRERLKTRVLQEIARLPAPARPTRGVSLKLLVGGVVAVVGLMVGAWRLGGFPALPVGSSSPVAASVPVRAPPEPAQPAIPQAAQTVTPARARPRTEAPERGARPPTATASPAPGPIEAAAPAPTGPELLHQIDAQVRAGRWREALDQLDAAGPELADGGWAVEAWALRALAQCTGGQVTEGLASAAHVPAGSTYEERIQTVCLP